MNIENYFSINLPSRCMVYKGVKPEDIKIRAYTGKEEIYLSEITYDNLELKFLSVLKQIITGIDPKDITLGDLQYIITWEYARSYTNIVKVPTRCSFCMQEIEATVDFGELDVVTLPDDFKQPYEKTLPSGKKVNLRLLTIGDSIAIQELGGKTGDVALSRCALSLVDGDDVLARMEKLSAGPISDIAAIRAFHEEFYHGPNMNAKFVCPKCERTDRVEVPFRFDFIYPRNTGLAIYFGKGISA